MEQHCIIPPSSAHIWGKTAGCTGWPLMAQMYPDPIDGGNGEDAEGTAAHEIGAAIIKRYAVGDYSIQREEYVDKIASNGVVVTDAMFDGALMYANNVNEVMRKHGVFGGPNFGIEKQLKILIVHKIQFGTPDLFIYDQKTKTLYIWDFKFGFIVHEAFENWQMINYLAGIVDYLKIDGITDQYVKVHIRVVQPRARHSDGPIREWKVKLSDLRGYFNILHANAHKALSNDGELKTGYHCRFCTARFACEPGLKAGMALYEVAGRPVPSELTNEQLGVQLHIIKRAISQLEYLETGYEERVKNLSSRGVRIPGWITEMGRGNLKWIKPIAEIFSLGRMLNKNLRKPDAAITPTQAINLGIDPSIIKLYSEKSETGLKVVPDTNLKNKAKQVFSS